MLGCWLLGVGGRESILESRQGAREGACDSERVWETAALETVEAAGLQNGASLSSHFAIRRRRRRVLKFQSLKLKMKAAGRVN